MFVVPYLFSIISSGANTTSKQAVWGASFTRIVWLTIQFCQLLLSRPFHQGRSVPPQLVCWQIFLFLSDRSLTPHKNDQEQEDMSSGHSGAYMADSHNVQCSLYTYSSCWVFAFLSIFFQDAFYQSKFMSRKQAFSAS